MVSFEDRKKKEKGREEEVDDLIALNELKQAPMDETKLDASAFSLSLKFLYLVPATALTSNHPIPSHFAL